jgi:hypothetical protein
MQSLFVLLAFAIVVFAEEEAHDQQTAEQFFATYGYYPSWYTPVVPSAVRSGYPYAGYPYAGYSYAYYG